MLAFGNLSASECEQAARFARDNLWNGSTKRLRRSFRQAPSDVDGFDNDYAFLAAGLLDLYAASGDTQWLAWADELQQALDELFWDSSSGNCCPLYFRFQAASSRVPILMFCPVAASF